MVEFYVLIPKIVLVVMKDVGCDKTNSGSRQYKFLNILWI